MPRTIDDEVQRKVQRQRHPKKTGEIVSEIQAVESLKKRTTKPRRTIRIAKIDDSSKFADFSLEAKERARALSEVASSMVIHPTLKTAPPNPIGLEDSSLNSAWALANATHQEAVLAERANTVAARLVNNNKISIRASQEAIARNEKELEELIEAMAQAEEERFKANATVEDLQSEQSKKLASKEASTKLQTQETAVGNSLRGRVAQKLKELGAKVDDTLLNRANESLERARQALSRKEEVREALMIEIRNKAEDISQRKKELARLQERIKIDQATLVAKFTESKVATEKANAAMSMMQQEHDRAEKIADEKRAQYIEEELQKRDNRVRQAVKDQAVEDARVQAEAKQRAEIAKKTTSATKIQAALRGHQSRKAVTQMKQDKQQRVEAEAKINRHQVAEACGSATPIDVQGMYDLLQAVGKDNDHKADLIVAFTKSAVSTNRYGYTFDKTKAMLVGGKISNDRAEVLEDSLTLILKTAYPDSTANARSILYVGLKETGAELTRWQKVKKMLMTFAGKSITGESLKSAVQRHTTTKAQTQRISTRLQRSKSPATNMRG